MICLDMLNPYIKTCEILKNVQRKISLNLIIAKFLEENNFLPALSTTNLKNYTKNKMLLNGYNNNIICYSVRRQ